MGAGHLHPSWEVEKSKVEKKRHGHAGHAIHCLYCLFTSVSKI